MLSLYPIVIIALEHDGIGEALKKMRTNVGKEPFEG